MYALSPLQSDALCEIFNISVGQAANAMSSMVNEEVLLNVPRIDFLSRDEAARVIDGSGQQRICSVSQNFEGEFTGEAMLMFPEENSLEIVRLMIGKTIPLSHMTELEQDALSEVGNIILNACVSTLSDLLRHDFTCSLPILRFGTGKSVFAEAAATEQDVVMFLQIEFQIEQLNTRGYLVFLVDIPTIDNLKRGIDRFLGGMPS